MCARNWEQVSSVLRGALVGFGKIAETTHVPALTSMGLSIAAVVELDPARQRAAAQILPNARIVSQVQQLWAGEKLDFVDICTPPYLHFEAAAAAVRAGLHVLCEKPLVFDLAQAMELTLLTQQKKVVLACMHNWTQAPIWQRCLKLVREQRNLRSVQMTTLRTEPAAVAGSANWRIDPAKAGGGIIFDHGWHAMSLLLRLFDSAPSQVRAKLQRQQHLSLAVEDTADVEIAFACGGQAHFHATWTAHERANRASLTLDSTVIELENDQLRWDGRSEHFEESLAGGGYRPAWTAGIITEWLREIRNESPRGRLLKEAVDCLRLLCGAYQSVETGGSFVEVK